MLPEVRGRVAAGKGRKAHGFRYGVGVGFFVDRRWYAEGWYNPYRRYSALDYLSPINYERRYHHLA
jgi:transposase InsO family protein